MRVVVTGASSGLGAEFARQLASKGHDLVLTARRAGPLEALATELRAARQVRVDVVALDLAAPDGPRALFEAATADGARVDMLINNAGYGYFSPFQDCELERALGLIDLNVRSLVELSHRFALHMLEGSTPAHIINVGSTASFQPVPNLAVYAATKAFVSSFSDALSVELSRTNLRVTAVHPGPTRTGFMGAAGMEVKENLLTRVVMMDPEDVVRQGLSAALGGRMSVVTGWLNKLLAAFTRFSPRRLTAIVSGKLMKVGI